MGKVWHYCVVVMDICFFSGLASLGYTGGGDVYVNDSGACGNDISSFSFLDKYRTDHMLEYTPVTPSAEIRITATDEYGRQLFTVTTKAES